MGLPPAGEAMPASATWEVGVTNSTKDRTHDKIASSGAIRFSRYVVR